ncbi:MAG: epimerase [Firmicutes bacterium HGW-Firmicutes-15]|nr:MAG: epimerase [Firmicutes bacterium HGW-Firmicutes-15]
MKVILFGATGMVGQGVLRECLLEPEVQSILSVGRSATGLQHEKLVELAPTNIMDLTTIEGNLVGYDACFFCLGVSSAGMTEQDYNRVTYDITLAVAETLVRLNPEMTFVYVSGTGTDSTENGRSMWARVKGKTENALLRLPFKAAYMFRPGFIQPMHGIVSKTKIYRMLYAVGGPLYPVLNRLLPNYVTTTEKIGRAMIAVAQQGYPKPLLENKDINSICNLK